MEKQFNLLVKFMPAAIAQVKNGEIFFSDAKALMQHNKFVLDADYRWVIPELAATGDLTCEENSIDFAQYKGLVYVETDLTGESLEELATRYKQLAIVDYVYLEPAQPIAPPSLEDVNVSMASTTDDLAHYQTYHSHAPAAGVIGLDTEFAWSLQITGHGIRVANIEWSHNFEHEDLVGANFIPLYPTNDTTHDDHGAAVASLTFARDNGFGMKGTAFDLDAFYGISELPNGRVAGIARGLLELRPGDIFSYQMQEWGRPNDHGSFFLVPTDFNPAVWDLTSRATAQGIVVIMAAGNGGENLLHPFYDEYRSRGDNGAIRVGAGNPVGRNRLFLSTFGENMVHVQGWGMDVASAGFGHLFNAGPNRRYTASFSGTSSATAMVSAAAVSIQSWYKQTYQRVLTSQQMRDIMVQTGQAQGTGEHIGPQPHIRYAIKQLGVQQL